MAIRVTLGNASQLTERLSVELPDAPDHIKMGRSVYQYLRSLKNAKEIVHDVDVHQVTSELIELFEAFNDKQAGESIDSEFEKLDEYLGDLGIEVDYYYSKDIIDIEPWIETTNQSPTRNVVYKDTVTDITYNVVYTDNTDVFDVIHRTNNS